MKRLGDLEAEVMNVLWECEDPQSVHDLLAHMSERKFAYTTILTVVTHLHEKGWVDRVKVSRAYMYSPAQSRAEATSQALREILDTSNDSAAVLMHFAKTVTDEELEALRGHLPDVNG
ncbi:penicillinase repressor [Rhodococcus sp. 06-1059B-a]|nr:BlaI/MecI/CopY family transcriptional regulator [Rhodococcus sp. 06-1059B-a]OZD70509.1 penicillinase repressor [Rhodococcus sp. 06-1059B-a]